MQDSFKVRYERNRSFIMEKKETVIVTGASHGIGATFVQAFLDRGHNVGVIYLAEARLGTGGVQHVDGGAHVGKW
jgi:NAD(P)-dependent dehydrogenase (short-subunit alcohol dehydrogenase family)